MFDNLFYVRVSHLFSILLFLGQLPPLGHGLPRPRRLLLDHPGYLGKSLRLVQVPDLLVLSLLFKNSFCIERSKSNFFAIFAPEVGLGTPPGWSSCRTRCSSRLGPERRPLKYANFSPLGMSKVDINSSIFVFDLVDRRLDGRVGDGDVLP